MTHGARQRSFSDSEEEKKNDVIQSPILEFYYFPKKLGHIAIKIHSIKDTNDLCDVFLMALPKKGKKYLETDPEHLYLYRDDEGIFYWKNNQRQNLKLTDEDQKHLVSLDDENFDGTTAKPTKLENKETQKAILKVTFAANHTNSNVYPFDGIYLSYGSAAGANFEYENGLEYDTHFYGDPVKIILQLPPTRISRLNQIANSFDRDSENYNLLHNNCADAALILLKNLYSENNPFKETSLATTPAYVANQVCSFILKQIESEKKTILTKEIPSLELDDLLKLIMLEQKRLRMEIKQEATGYVTTTETKNLKIGRLGILKSVIENTSEQKTPEAYQELLKQFKYYQKLIGDRTAKLLETCIEKFPYDNLLSDDKKSGIVNLLIQLYENIKKDEQTLRSKSGNWMGKIKGLDKILEKLDIQQLKQYQETNKCPRPIIKQFIKQYFEIEAIINKKATDGKKRDPRIQKFYTETQLTLFSQTKSPKQDEKPEMNPPDFKKT